MEFQVFPFGEQAHSNPDESAQTTFGLPVSPMQLGIGALVVGGLAYYWYSSSTAAGTEAVAGGIEAVSLTIDGLPAGTADVEEATTEEVATPVVMPELTKAAWLKKIKANKEFKQLSAEASGTAKITKVAVIKEPVTFYSASPNSQGFVPVIAQPGVDQLITVAVSLQTREGRHSVPVYFLARADESVVSLGMRLMKGTSSVKVTPSTSFVPVDVNAIATKTQLDAAGQKEVVDALKKVKSKFTELKLMRTPISVKYVYTLPVDTVLAVTVKDRKGNVSRMGAKLFKAGDRIARVKTQVVAGTPVFADFVISAEGKVTAVQLKQPIQGQRVTDHR